MLHTLKSDNKIFIKNMPYCLMLQCDQTTFHNHECILILLLGSSESDVLCQQEGDEDIFHQKEEGETGQKEGEGVNIYSA